MTPWLRAVLAPGAAILLGLLIGVAAGPHILAYYAKLTRR